MLLSIDQGTTGTTVFVVDLTGQIKARTYQEFTQIYPQPSWVEHDPMEIWQVTLDCIQQAIKEAGITFADLKGIGVTNQRETSIIWDRATGKPIYNAIVWQCRRTAPRCEEIKQQGQVEWLHHKTGLVVDAYFSATKVQWLLDNVDGARQKAENAELAFGTIDSWLMWQLSAGEIHKTDHTNASRTMLYNITRRWWDDELLEEFNVPISLLPDIQNSSSVFGHTDEQVMGASVPICGVAGDQQAALFGQRCFEAGQSKNTYGTGCFMLMHTGERLVRSDNGLLTTVVCNEAGAPEYALEGSVFMGGAAVQWLRDELNVIQSASETEAIARSVPDSNGVCVVPAFTGLGAPHWDMSAKGGILGLTRGANYKHIVRATLEGVAFQVSDVLQQMKEDAGINIEFLCVDGGACANDFLMEFQADILQLELRRPQNLDSTAMGVVMLAAMAIGEWGPGNWPQILRGSTESFEPNMDTSEQKQHLSRWHWGLQQIKTRSVD